MSRKIAPRLREIVDDLDGHPDFLKSDHRVCDAELRALLAVARAAEKCRLRGDLRDGENLDRALDRLSHLSSPKPRRGSR